MDIKNDTPLIDGWWNTYGSGPRYRPDGSTVMDAALEEITRRVAAHAAGTIDDDEFARGGITPEILAEVTTARDESDARLPDTVHVASAPVAPTAVATEAVALDPVRVRAIAAGFDGVSRRAPGDVFTIPAGQALGSWMELATTETVPEVAVGAGLSLTPEQHTTSKSLADEIESHIPDVVREAWAKLRTLLGHL